MRVLDSVVLERSCLFTKRVSSGVKYLTREREEGENIKKREEESLVSVTMTWAGMRRTWLRREVDSRSKRESQGGRSLFNVAVKSSLSSEVDPSLVER